MSDSPFATEDSDLTDGDRQNAGSGVDPFAAAPTVGAEPVDSTDSADAPGASAPFSDDPIAVAPAPADPAPAPNDAIPGHGEALPAPADAVPTPPEGIALAEGTGLSTDTVTAPANPVPPPPEVPLPDPGPGPGPIVTPDAGAPAVATSTVPQAPPRKLRPLPRIIAVANQKGGVGKTTTTVNLGAALAEQDHRVLVIDLDPQGNATTGLGINSRELDHSIYDVLLNDVDLEDCIEPTSVLNLFLAPASLDLAGAEIELVSVMSRETRLRRAIEQVASDYDYVLIDCPPSLGLLTVNALAAAGEVMVPIQCEYYALEGLGQLMRNVDLVQRNLNPRLELSLIVLVMYDGRTKLGEQVATEVREHFGERVCRNVIPRNIRLSEAPSYGQPITVFDSSSKGAVAYRELAREVHHGSA